MFSTCHNLIDTHLQSQASNQAILYWWLSTARKSGKLIVFLTQNSEIGNSITLLNGLDTDMHIQVGSQQKTSGMLRSWWTKSTAAIQESRDSGGKGSIWHSFFLSFFHDWTQSSTNGLGTGFITSKSQSSGGWVCPCAVSTGQSWEFFLGCLVVLFLYEEMQPRRSAARQGIM